MKPLNFKTMGKTIFLFMLSLVFTGMLSNRLAAQDITGKWHGMLEFTSASLRLDLVVGQEDGKYTATLYSPDQGNNPIPVDEFSYSDGKMEFTVAALDVKFSGEMDEASSTIKGIFNQHGQSLPLVLGRKIIEAPGGSAPGQPAKPDSRP